MKKLLAILFSVLFFLPATKGQGEIYGTVTDEKGNPFQSVTISVYQNGKLFLSTFSEDDGSYSLKPLLVGCYKVEFKVEHYIKTIVVDLPISSGGCVKLNCKMIEGSNDSEMITVFKIPKIPKLVPKVHIVDNNKIQDRHKYPTLYGPTHNEKNRFRIGGNRATTTVYLIDGLVDETSDSTDSTRFNWLNANKLRKKTYTEKDFQYIPFGHFLETLPGLQR